MAKGVLFETENDIVCCLQTGNDIMCCLKTGNDIMCCLQTRYDIMCCVQTGNNVVCFLQTENDVARSIVLALAVCYLARLEEKTRQEFAAHVADRLEDLWSLSHMKGETPPSESADKFMFRQHAL